MSVGVARALGAAVRTGEWLGVGVGMVPVEVSKAYLA